VAGLLPPGTRLSASELEDVRAHPERAARGALKRKRDERAQSDRRKARRWAFASIHYHQNQDIGFKIRPAPFVALVRRLLPPGVHITVEAVWVSRHTSV
jgi:hypothetical protein